jgi:hypothetical protein
VERPVIRPLRRMHRRIFVLLAVLLPLVLFVALTRRAEAPIQRDWPFGEQP